MGNEAKEQGKKGKSNDQHKPFEVSTQNIPIASMKDLTPYAPPEEKSSESHGILSSTETPCNPPLSETPANFSEEDIINFFSKETYKVAPQRVTCVEYCPDLNLFITGGEHGLLTLWDSITMSYSSHVTLHDKAIVAVAYLPTIKTIVTSSRDCSTGIITLNNDGSILYQTKLHTSKVFLHMVAIEDENKVATSSQGAQKIRIWKPSAKQPKDSVQIQLARDEHILGLFYIPGEKLLGVTYPDLIELYSLKSNTLHCKLEAHLPIISTCFIERGATIHMIVRVKRDPAEFKEIIWVKDREDSYSIYSRRQVDSKFGRPIEVQANNNMVFTIFKNGFDVRRSELQPEGVKSMPLWSHDCKEINQKPIYLDRNEMKLVVAHSYKRIKCYFA